MARVLHDVKRNWYYLIPEAARPPLKKKGKVIIRFAIAKDGQVREMKLENDGSPVDYELGRAT